jgi:hypothetical protein
MKKTLLAICATFGIAAFAVAQDGIEIYVNGGMTDYSSGNGVFQTGPEVGGEAVADIHIENHTGASVDWVVTRLRINEQATWTDYLCWGHETDPFGGTCYSASLMPTNPWCTPAAVTVGDTEGGVIAAHITPDIGAPATVTYRYYVSTDCQTYADSVDIEVSFSLGLEEATPELSVSVAPNPASDNITVKANGVESAQVKMVDVLGNVVLREKMVASKTINVAEFRNGIYFIIVEAEGAKPVSRKVIVRH